MPSSWEEEQEWRRLAEGEADPEADPGHPSDASDASNAEPERQLIPAPSDPLAVARVFVGERYLDGSERLLLRNHRNTFYRYVGDHWPEDDERRVESELWHWLEDKDYVKITERTTRVVNFEPTRAKVGEVITALRALGHVPEGVQPPVWLSNDGSPSLSAEASVPLATASSTSTSAGCRRTRPRCSSTTSWRSGTTRMRRSRCVGSASSTSCGPTTSSRSSPWPSGSATCSPTRRTCRRCTC
jgi:hypothetical protein